MWALILHGGARDIESNEEAGYRRGCENALQIGYKILQYGGSALDAVVATITAMEDDPVFNAGYGCALNETGETELSAAVMDGKTLDIGAVASLKGVKNPVLVAQAMLRKQTILLAGDGAHRFAAASGAELCEPHHHIIAKPKRSGTHDTVGCVALDMNGNFAVADSTGGIEGRPAGRIGDSPLPGCGFYAENGIGAVTLSGDGEHIARAIIAARIVLNLPQKGVQDAIDDSLTYMYRLGGEAGAIAIGPDGSIGWNHNSREFSVGLASSMRPAKVYLRKAEETDAP